MRFGNDRLELGHATRFGKRGVRPTLITPAPAPTSRFDRGARLGRRREPSFGDRDAEERDRIAAGCGRGTARRRRPGARAVAKAREALRAATPRSRTVVTAEATCPQPMPWTWRSTSPGRIVASPNARVRRALLARAAAPTATTRPPAIATAASESIRSPSKSRSAVTSQSTARPASRPKALPRRAADEEQDERLHGRPKPRTGGPVGHVRSERLSRLRCRRDSRRNVRRHPERRGDAAACLARHDHHGPGDAACPRERPERAELRLLAYESGGELVGWGTAARSWWVHDPTHGQRRWPSIRSIADAVSARS